MKTQSILAINDRESDLKHLTDTLKVIGYTNIYPVHGGGNAWAILKSEKIDCVISSYDMDEMSGIALLKILRREESVADLPFFLTDDSFTKLKVIKAGQIGVTGLFVIPFDKLGMEKKIAAALGKIKDAVILVAEKGLEQGIQLIENQKYDKALQIFQSLVNQRENPEYYYNIGYIKTTQGHHSEAIEAFSKATQMDRLFVKAYEAMAKAYKALGDQQKAEECLQTAAEIYMDTDKLGSAEDILNEILESGSSSLNVFNTLGVIHRKKGDVKQALRNYKKALKVHPDEPYIYYNIGRLYLDMKESTRAKTYFEAALNKDANFQEAKQVIKAIDLGLV